MHARLHPLAVLTAALLTACASAAGPSGGPPADLVILGGRVIDPETALDGTRNVAVRDGRILAVTAAPVSGRDTIDARGLVVAPGFIDLHQHAQDSAAYLHMVRDGTTAAFELEEGTADVAEWYAVRAGRAAVHHGVAAGHAAVRARVFGDSVLSDGAFAPDARVVTAAATQAELVAILAGLDRGLDEGAVAVGVLLGYTPGATPWEILELFRVAARHRASVHLHVRSTPEPLWFLEVSELIGAAAATGASGHLLHINSSMQEDAPRVLQLLRGARERGVDVTTEAYPYSVAMTTIQAADFSDWESWPDDKFRRFEWAATGERLTRETFAQRRREGGVVAMHPADSAAGEAWVRAALSDSLVMIASDGVLDRDVGHPRTVGTHARVLGRYVREAGVLTLGDAIRRMTLDPARRLEQRVPVMRRKGRLQPGADADIVVFDPATVIDRATFREPTLASAGIPHVLVGGEPVVRDARLTGRLPGVAIRAPARQ